MHMLTELSSNHEKMDSLVNSLPQNKCNGLFSLPTEKGPLREAFLHTPKTQNSINLFLVSVTY